VIGTNKDFALLLVALRHRIAHLAIEKLLFLFFSQKIMSFVGLDYTHVNATHHCIGCRLKP
jgi:hypothetical protein